MSKKWFVVRALATLIIIGLLILGGFAIHRIGWLQGYRMGQLAAGSERSMTVPYSFGYPGLFLTVGLILLLLVVIGKFLHLLIWGPWMMVGRPWAMACGPKGAHWARHWRRPHSPMPPWCWGWEEPAGEKTEKVKPDADASAVETD